LKSSVIYLRVEGERTKKRESCVRVIPLKFLHRHLFCQSYLVFAAVNQRRKR